GWPRLMAIAPSRPGMPYAAAATSGLTNPGPAPGVAKGLGPKESPGLKPVAAGVGCIRLVGAAPNPDGSDENPLTARGPGTRATVVRNCGICGKPNPGVMLARPPTERGPGAAGHENPSSGGPVQSGPADPKSDSCIDFSFIVDAFLRSACGRSLRSTADLCWLRALHHRQ